MAVLITCALSAKAYQVKKSITNGEVVVLGDYAEVPELMLKSGQIIKLPSPMRPSYQHEMLALCLDNNITTLYALGEDETVALSESEQLFNEYGITLAK